MANGDTSIVPGVTPATTPPFLPGSAPAAGGTDPSAQVSEMTKRILQTLAQSAQRKQFAGQPMPSPVPGRQDPTPPDYMQRGPQWGKLRFMHGLQANIQNAVAKQKQNQVIKAEADWTYMQGALNELYQAQSSNDPKAVAAAQQKVDVVMGDPKKLKNMAKALNQDWLNPEKTTVYGEALKSVNAKKQQTDQQKDQAKQGVMGIFRKLMGQQQQPQLSPEQQQGMGREIAAKAPSTTPGLDSKALEAQEKILHDRANEALAAKRDETASAYRKAELAIQEARLTQQKEEKKVDEQRREQELELKKKTEEETTRHHKEMETIESKRVAAASGGGAESAKDIVAAIKAGDQPPTTQGLYKLGPAVRAEAARQHLPLARMETDWKATQRYIATLNGPQQTRLRQDISTVSGSLDKVEGLYDEWEKLAKTSGYRLINRGTLRTMEELPGRAGAVARALEAQIADTTAGLGTIYMGGNSPTDHSLDLAAHSLSSDWNDETFREGLKQARENVEIRNNSIVHSLPAGVSVDSPYAQKTETAPATGGMETQTYNGATYQRKKGSKDQWTLVPTK